MLINLVFVALYMPILTLKYQGKIYQREVLRNFAGIYIMRSKGVDYWFRKDDYIKTYKGWHLVNGTELPDFMMDLITEELERLNHQL